MVAVKRLIAFFNNQKRLEDKIFNFVLIVGIIVVAVSTVVTYAEQLSAWATILTASSGLFMILIFIFAYGTHHVELARNMLCYIMNLLILPITFFTCGGINSGMPLYFLAGLFMIIPILKGKNRLVCFFVSLISQACVIGISYNMMEGNKAKTQFDRNILAQLTLEDRIIDMICSLVMVSAFVCVTSLLIFSSYQKEREKSDELLEKLNILSKKDELTGLFNRRELFSYLETVNLFEKKQYYIAMFDIDHFKDVNDTYGHVFGDVALHRVAQEMDKIIDDSKGEIAARYGGEEFVLLLNEPDMDSALKRVDDLRIDVGKLNWEEHSNLRVTISGGLVDCSKFDNLNATISTVDQLLYKAKHTGRNRIEV